MTWMGFGVFCVLAMLGLRKYDALYRAVLRCAILHRTDMTNVWEM